MKIKRNTKGSVLLVSVFASVLFGAMLIGIMQINTEEIMMSNNHIGLTGAVAIAEAGLNEAYYNIRRNRNWTAGFTTRSFGGGFYTVTVSGTLPSRKLVSTGVTRNGYKARVDADIIVGRSVPYSVTIIETRIND